MPRDAMSEQQLNIRFVRAIEKHPCLYNFDLPSYTRKDMTDKAWEEVGRATDMTPSACRERWRNLRAVFMRTVKAASQGQSKKKPYYLSDVMQFVVPYMRPTIATEKNEKPKATEIKNVIEDAVIIEIEKIKTEPEDDDEQDITYEEVKPSSAKKRQIDNSEDHIAIKKPALASTSTIGSDSDDPVRSFLNSLVPELNEMNLAQFKSFKRRVLVLIDDITGDIPLSTKHEDGSEYIM